MYRILASVYVTRHRPTLIPNLIPKHKSTMKNLASSLLSSPSNGM